MAQVKDVVCAVDAYSEEARKNEEEPVDRHPEGVASRRLDGWLGPRIGRGWGQNRETSRRKKGEKKREQRREYQ